MRSNLHSLPLILLLSIFFIAAVYAGLGHANSQSHWPPDFQKEFSASFFYHFDLILRRQWKILIRDSTLIKSRVAQCIVVGVVAASLFSNIGVTDTDTMDGFLFFAALFNALAYFDIIPTVYAQREVSISCYALHLLITTFTSCYY